MTRQAKIISINSNLFTLYKSYTPDDLIKIAMSMKEKDILSVEFSKDHYGDDWDFWVEISRYETEEEVEARLIRERKNAEFEQQKAARRKLELIEEAKKLGLKISE